MAGSSRGRWVVLVLLLLGVIAGVCSIIYWTGVIERTWPEGQEPAGQASPSTPEDLANAHLQLQQIQESYSRVAASQQPLTQVVRAAREFTARFPDYAPGYTFLGVVLLETSQYDQAQQALSRSLELDPSQPEVHLNAATLAQRRGDIEQARIHYEAAIALAPTTARYRVHLAQLLLEQQQLEQARQQLDEAMKLDSNAHTVHALLSDLAAREQRIPQALEHMTRAIELTPVAQRNKQVAYLRKKAALLELQQKHDQALQVLGNLTIEERSQSDVLEQIALNWDALGKPDQAARAYEQAMVQRPGDWRLIAAAAHWWLQAGDPAQAQRQIETLRKLNPRAPQIPELEAALRR